MVVDWCLLQCTEELSSEIWRQNRSVAEEMLNVPPPSLFFSDDGDGLSRHWLACLEPSADLWRFVSIMMICTPKLSSLTSVLQKSMVFDQKPCTTTYGFDAKMKVFTSYIFGQRVEKH